MVIDAAKGIEPRTRKLFEVCRLRDIPIITFINKMDRESRDPFELLVEASGRVEDHGELLRETGVPMRGRRHHVQHPFPDLVFAVLVEAFAALEQRLQLGGR